MTASDDFLNAWLCRIESKLDAFGEQLAPIKTDIALLQTSVKELEDMKEIRRKVDSHERDLTVIKWVAGVVAVVIIPASLWAIWTLITHGQPIMQWISTVTPTP